MPTTTTADAIALDEAYVMPTYTRYPIEFVAGRGAELTDAEGRRYIDLLAGIGAVSLGHAHPALVEALQTQAGRVWQVSNYFHEEHRGELARLLSELLSVRTDEAGHMIGTTGDTWKCFFSNSGAESNEGAIKLARRWGERRLDGAAGIITAHKSFHGRTLATLSATGQERFHASFGPMPAGFAAVPLNDIDALERALDHPEVSCGVPACAVMLECVQGEGGVWPATFDYLRDVRALTSERGLALIVDEVQTGIFRTGAPFAYQLAGIEPDVVSMAKGIASGFPTGAVAAREELADLMHPGDHGSTFGGNALAAAVAQATLETLVNERIGEHVISVGSHLRERLEALPHVSEVRGHGLMLGAQLDIDRATPLVERGLEAGLVLNHVGESILRLLPPLVITDAQVDEACDRLESLIVAEAAR